MIIRVDDNVHKISKGIFPGYAVIISVGGKDK